MPPPQSQLKYVLCHFGRPLNVSWSDAANRNIPTIFNTFYAGEIGRGAFFSEEEHWHTWVTVEI
jgi:hypothetical protein